MVTVHLPLASLPFKCDGANRSLSSKNHCRVGVADSPHVEHLPLRCARCKMVYYCSRECQERDSPKHKACCTRIASLMKNMEEQRCTLMRFPLLGEPTNLFEAFAGEFETTIETLEYLETLSRLTLQIEFLLLGEPKEAWEIPLQHVQEVLRLNARDNLGMRYHLPPILLWLDRDDDCFAFCRHWCKASADHEEEYLAFHRSSKEGDWIYGHDKDCRYHDFFEACSPMDPQGMPWPMLVTVSLIKIRLVIPLLCRSAALEVFRDTDKGKMLDSVMPVIASMYRGDDACNAVLDAQLGQLDYLFDLIDQKNPSMLPSWVHPAQLPSDYQSSRFPVEGQPSEAMFVVNPFVQLWNHIPGAKELLEARYGPKPEYNCT